MSYLLFTIEKKYQPSFSKKSKSVAIVGTSLPRPIPMNNVVSQLVDPF